MKEKTLKKLKETGITLIALVVTIIILLILAGVTLNLVLGDGGILARAKNTADRYQAAQANEVDQLTKFEEMLNTYGNGETSTGGDEETTNTVTPPPPTPSTGTSAGDLSEKLEGDDSVIGKIVKGLTGGVAESYTWEIFYADENNIYLISTDYIKIEDCPQKDGVTLTKGGQCARDAYVGLADKYQKGSEDINDIGKELNKSYFIDHKYTSTYDNMKGVAYMLDTDIWKDNIVGAENSKVKYVVGGPSIEILFKAYNAKKGTNYQAQASSIAGYQISKDGSSWKSEINDMLDSKESAFVITSTTNAYGYWISSPLDYGYKYYSVASVSFKGNVSELSGIDYYACGYRPLICLNNDVVLEEDSDGYKIK